MVRSILVPLDGSRFAEEALPVALGLARRAGASVNLVLAHEPEPALVPAGEGHLMPAPDDDVVRASELTYLSDIADRADCVASATSFQVVEGMPVPVLIEAVATQRPDLVVMATHGRGPFRRFWLGSVADELTREAEIPILLVHPRGGAEPRPEPVLRRFLVAVDFSIAAEAILPIITDLVSLAGGHITLMHVVEALAAVTAEPMLPYPVAIGGDTLTARTREAHRRLERLAARLGRLGLSVSTRVEVGGSVALMLQQALREECYDVLALTTHGRSGFQRALLGSVADRMIRSSEKPILVFRPAAPAL